MSPVGLLHKVNRWGSVIAGALVMVMMLAIVADVVGRKTVGALPGVIELVALMLVFVVFLSIAHTEQLGGHIRVNLVVKRLPEKVADSLDVLAYLLGFIFFGLIGWRSLQMALSSLAILEYASAAPWLPVYPSKFAITVGCWWICLQFVTHIIASVRKMAVSGGQSQPTASSGK